MTSLVQRSLASSILGAVALFLVGCGGGGGGATTPTATPIGTPSGTATATPIPTATTVPGTGGSPVGANQVAFVSNRANPNSGTGATDIYKSNTDGSGVVRLTSLNQPIDKPAVSRDGARLVFQIGSSNSNGGINNFELGIINANGSGFQQLTQDTTPGGRPDDYNPVFSADGQYIYWTSTRGGLNENGLPVDGVPHIWRMRGAVGNTGIEQEQFIREASALPSVDRNGNIAYVALSQTTSPITLRTSAGALIKRISDSTPASQISDLALSPDGTRISFSAANGTGSTAPTQIRIYNVGTSGREGASPSGGTFNGGSAWGRDSQTLFFDAASSGRRQIFSSPLPFSSVNPVTLDTSSDNYSPAFLPVS